MIKPLFSLPSEPAHLEPETLVVDATVVGAAATQACDSPAGNPHPFMNLPTTRAMQQITAFHPACRKRELVGAPLSGNTEITTCLLPFGTVRGESSPAVAMLCKQVGKLVNEGAIHFLEGYLPQGRV